jgi:hypothetical protein
LAASVPEGAQAVKPERLEGICPFEQRNTELLFQMSNPSAEIGLLESE